MIDHAEIWDTISFLEANPHLWEQGGWWHMTKCETVGCLAGWVCHRAGYQFSYEIDGSSYLVKDGIKNKAIGNTAARLLGLTCRQAEELFAYDNTMDDLKRIAKSFHNEEIGGPGRDEYRENVSH